MSCLDCLIKLFQTHVKTVYDLDHIIIQNNNDTKDIIPVLIPLKEEEDDEIIYSRDSQKLDQTIIKRIIKKEIDYNSDDSWDNSLIL
tara:strand:+ start:287 stop:547 length:261 start_codon:yes stop_codon:yes gene_type:complete